MKAGRLAIRYDPRKSPRYAEFLVVPDDGDEPILLRVNKAFVRARIGEAAIASIRCYLHSIEIGDIEGRSFRADGQGKPVIYPQVELYELGEANRDRGAVSWRFDADGSLPRLTFVHFAPEPLED